MSEPTIEFLQSVPLFAGLPRRELKEIASALKERTFAAGDTVVAEGEGGVGFFVVETGTARVERRGLQVGAVGPGSHFGEIAVIGEVDRVATIVAETELRCWGMLPWAFRPLVEGNSKIAWRLLEQFARRAAAE